MEITIRVNEEGLLQVTPSEGMNKIQAIGLLEMAKMFIVTSKPQDTDEEVQDEL